MRARLFAFQPNLKMPDTCVVFGCTNRAGKTVGVGFYRFPANPNRRELWEKAVARKDWKAKDHSRLCGHHFIHGELCFALFLILELELEINSRGFLQESPTQTLTIQIMYRPYIWMESASEHQMKSTKLTGMRGQNGAE